MPRFRSFFRLLVIAGVLVLAAHRGFSQSNVAEAQKAFNLGLTEQSDAKKIVAFSRAVQLDPDFAEALYQLGLAHKTQGDYRRAEEFLQKAYGAKTAGMSAELKQSILLELVMTYNKRGNIVDYEAALRRTKRLATATKVRAQVAYELGLFLHQQQRDKEALAELREALQFEFVNRAEASNLIRIIELHISGVAALRDREWARAQLAFEKMLEMDPNDRETRRRLQEAQKNLDRETTEAIASRYYAEGVAAMQRNDFLTAFAALDKTRTLNPNYRDTAQLLAEVEVALKKMAAAAPAHAEVNVDSLYKEGRSAFEKQEWLQAIVALEKVHLLQPDHREASELLTRARNKWSMTEHTKGEASQNEGDDPSVYVQWGAVLAVLLMAIWLLWSKENLARLHLWRGKYELAAQVYQTILTRHPTRVKLYRRLADLYMLMGRRDETALKVYRMTLQLQLAAQNHYDMSAIVAESFLAEGRTDSDAIQVFEDALKAEQDRKK